VAVDFLTSPNPVSQRSQTPRPTAVSVQPCYVPVMKVLPVLDRVSPAVLLPSSKAYPRGPFLSEKRGPAPGLRGLSSPSRPHSL